MVDLAAGTGILTRAALALGHEVVPVEPDPGMRAQLAHSTPGTTALAGSAEAVPLPDSTADAVLAGRRTTGSTGSPRTPRSPGYFAPVAPSPPSGTSGTTASTGWPN